MTETLLTQLTTLGPTLWIAALAMLALVIDLIVPKHERDIKSVVLVGLALIFLFTFKRVGSTGAAFYGSIVQTDFTTFFDLLFTAIAFFVIILSGPYFQRTGMKLLETMVLMLFATSGAMLMTLANDMLILFLGLELMSICLYVLAGMLRNREKSNEGALKYFLLGAFATGFFLYGIALLYGISGSTLYGDISAWVLGRNFSVGGLFWAGIGLLLIGFFFKTATVPFHFWAPDAYEGAPTPVTAFFSATPKAAAFAALIKVFGVALPSVNSEISDLLALFAILTMIIGNFVALQQSSVKRMLAYSSIAHAGYLLVAVVSASSDGYSALMLYLAAYAATNLGAFTIAYLVNRKNEGNYSFDNFNGLGAKHPYYAMMMAIFMISLAGIPPTGGFMGKYYIFFAAVRSGHLYLAIAMALISVVSVYYYLRVIVHMYMKPAAENYESIDTNKVVGIALLGCVAVILLIGVMPEPWFQWLQASVCAIGM